MVTIGESSVQPYPSMISSPVMSRNFAASSGRSFSAPVMTSRSDLSCSGFALRM